MPAEEVVCFLHIPKNAGTTIRSILLKSYGTNSVADIMLQGRVSVDGDAKTVDSLDEDVFVAVSEIIARQNDLACITANLPFGIHRYLDRKVHYFAMLREPVSRCISYWNFAYQNRKVNPLWSLLKKHGFDLDYILDRRIAYQFTNDQVRMICGTAKPELDETDLRKARDLIQKRYSFVGAVEHFGSCFELLKKQFGWRTTRIPHLNVGLANDPFIASTKARKRLRDANEWDIKLHEWLLKKYLPRHLTNI